MTQHSLGHSDDNNWSEYHRPYLWTALTQWKNLQQNCSRCAVESTLHPLCIQNECYHMQSPLAMRNNNNNTAHESQIKKEKSHPKANIITQNAVCLLYLLGIFRGFCRFLTVQRVPCMCVCMCVCKWIKPISEWLHKWMNEQSEERKKQKKNHQINKLCTFWGDDWTLNQIML